MCVCVCVCVCVCKCVCVCIYRVKYLKYLSHIIFTCIYNILICIYIIYKNIYPK